MMQGDLNVIGTVKNSLDHLLMNQNRYAVDICSDNVVFIYDGDAFEKVLIKRCESLKEAEDYLKNIISD